MEWRPTEYIPMEKKQCAEVGVVDGEVWVVTSAEERYRERDSSILQHREQSRMS